MDSGTSRSVPSVSKGSGRDVRSQGELVRRLVIAAVVLAALAAACGSEEPDPSVISAGQVDSKLPDGWTVEDARVVPPAEVEAAPTGGTGPGQEAAATTTPPDTIPLSEDDPQTAFFQAASVFQGCLDDEGFSFMGLPDSNNP